MTRAQEIGVIVNPNAARVPRDLAARLRAQVGAHGLVTETASVAELPGALRDFAARGVELVATVGGDGTNLAVVTELVRVFGDRLPTVAFLRGGTVNTVAANLGIRGRPEHNLARLLAHAGVVPTAPHEVMAIALDGGAPAYGSMCAAAMGARFLKAYYSGPMGGMAWALLLTARTIVSSLVSGAHARWLFEPLELALTIDGEPAPLDRTRLLVCATVRDLGLGFRVAWRAGTDPGRFHLIASALSTTRMALELPRIFAGRPLTGQPHLDRLARTVRFAFASPQPITIDGELYEARTVDVHAGPRLAIALV